MLENEFHKLEEKQENQNDDQSDQEKRSKKQDVKKAFWNCSKGKESMIVVFYRGRCKDKEK